MIAEKPISEQARLLLVRWKNPALLRAWQVRDLCELASVGEHTRRLLFSRESAARKYLRPGCQPRYHRDVVLESLGLL